MGIFRSTKRHWCHTSTFEILGVVGCFNMEFSVFFWGEQLPTPTCKISVFLVGKAIFGPVRHCQALCLLMLYKCCFFKCMVINHLHWHQQIHEMCLCHFLFLSNNISAISSRFDLRIWCEVWPSELCGKEWRIIGNDPKGVGWRSTSYVRTMRW